MGNKSNKMLGIAFLFQFITSLTSGIINKSLLFPSGEATEIFSAITAHAALLDFTVFLDILTALGVIFLGAALYQAVKHRNRTLAMAGMGFYLLEGVFHLISQIKSLQLLRYGREYSMDPSGLWLERANSLLASKELEGIIMMMAFCAGAILFYSQFSPAGIAPPWLSLWGLISVTFLALWTTLSFFGIEIPFFLYLPYVPFEAFIGIWILAKGTKEPGHE